MIYPLVSRRISLAMLFAFANVALMIPSIGWAESCCSSTRATVGKVDCVETQKSDRASSTCCSEKTPAPKSAPKSTLDSTNNSASKNCCCSDKASECQCVDCQCGSERGSQPRSPAIPTNETTEIVVSVFVEFTSAFEVIPNFCDARKLLGLRMLAEPSFLTAQQVCVLLSRFRC